VPCSGGYDGSPEERQDRKRGRTAQILEEAEAFYLELAARETEEPGAVSTRMREILERAAGAAEPVTGLLFVPAASEFEALAALRYGGFNCSPPTAVHIAILRHWKERYGAHLAGLSFDTLHLSVPRPPGEEADVRRARFEIDLLQADEFPLDPRAPIWRFWWD
jgi:hypothetical protein